MAQPPGSVRHDESAHRYEYVLDGAVVAVAEYRPDGDRLVMHHTYTDPAHRDQGIAAHLVHDALDDVRRRGRRVVPACWFVAEFVGTRPEYDDLVAAPSAPR
jgi:predicted GNAT family acetyltransferase